MGGSTASLPTIALGDLLLVPVAVAFLWLLAATAWRRVVGRDFEPITAPTAAPNLVLMALPTILGASAISVTAGLYAIALVAIVSLWMRRSPNDGLELVWPSAILPVVALTIVLRPNYPRTVLNVLFFVMACVVIARAVYLSTSKSSALISLIDGVGVFLVASIVLWFAGFDAAHERTVGLDNSLIGGERVVFPLSNSLAATPAMATVYIAAVIPILIGTSRYRHPRLVAVACAFSILFLSDSRVSLVGALFLSACVLLIPRVFRGAAPLLIGASLIVPFIYGYIQNPVGQTVTSASSHAPWLIRPNEKAATLNQRDYIWSQSLDFWDRVDWGHQVFGFGSFGHAASGASESYYRSFGGLGRDDRLMTPHSSTLQILFDGGWLIAGILAVTAICIAWVLSRRTSPIYLAGLAMLTALSIVGITEVALSPGHAQPTWWVLVALGIIVFSRERPVPHQTASRGMSRQAERSDQMGAPKVAS